MLYIIPIVLQSSCILRYSQKQWLDMWEHAMFLDIMEALCVKSPFELERTEIRSHLCVSQGRIEA